MRPSPVWFTRKSAARSLPVTLRVKLIAVDVLGRECEGLERVRAGHHLLDLDHRMRANSRDLAKTAPYSRRKSTSVRVFGRFCAFSGSHTEAFLQRSVDR